MSGAGDLPLAGYERRGRLRRRRRRPSGEAPPLPRELGRSGRLWIAVAVILFLIIVVAALSGAGGSVTDVDVWILKRIAALRHRWVTDAAEAVNALGARLTVRVLRWAVIIALVVFRRWRHLLVFLGTVLVVEAAASMLQQLLLRPRPFGVTTLAGWSGPSMPSRPVVAFGITLIGAAYTLAVPGRPRLLAKVAAGIAIGLLGLAELLLATNHPTDVVFGAVFAVAAGVGAFRSLVPNAAFPVAYGKRGKGAHLDVGGRRGEAIRGAVHDQLGLDVLEMKPVGLEGSGASTPLLITAADGSEERKLFGKLLASSHVRSDRWYKFGRGFVYGRLEDEVSFKTVRRLAEAEDYRERLIRDAGITTAAPLGIVEITPEREYLIVTEFFEGAVEISEADVDESVIDQGLAFVARLWDTGLAHRDIKPANLMVRDGELLLIDVGFAEVRPSPWRQAVDLGNMMLCLALRSDAETVYERALLMFTPDEIAEAFAATRSIAIPTELRARIKRDGRDLPGEFRSLAPKRRPIPIQTWGLRRVLLTLWFLLVTIVAIIVAISITGAL